jgi:AcrR family transcriptional regulator
MNHTKPSLKPRKTPVQARSAATVESIFTATIQVLLETGFENLTTTKVAQRAGASVGTLYQYFPNKNALLASVLEQYLTTVVEAVESACNAVKGQSAEKIAAAIVNAYLDAKLNNAQASKALHSVAAEVGGVELRARMLQRYQIALCDALATASDAKFNDLKTLSFVLSTAMSGPVQALLTEEPTPKRIALLREHLGKLAGAYLKAFATPAIPSQAPRARGAHENLSGLI